MENNLRDSGTGSRASAQEISSNPANGQSLEKVIGNAVELIEDVSQTIGQSILTGAQVISTAAQETARMVKAGLLPLTTIAGDLLPPVEPSRSERPAERDKPTETADHIKKPLEKWSKLINDAGLPAGPYTDLMMEFGKQLITGKFDSAKLQEFMKKAHESDTDHLVAWKAGLKLSDMLKDSGMRIDLDPKAWGIRIAEPIVKDQWSVSMSLEKDGKSDFLKRKFLNPDGPFPECLAAQKEDISAEDAFKQLSSKFRGVMDR